MLRGEEAFPPCADGTPLDETLELYIQSCAICSTCEAMATMASTLANGGLNPFTGEAVFAPEHVRMLLPLMLTCGMNDSSGKWAYEVGVPGKAGSSGVIFMVIPNVGGICIWSPRLDHSGNSVRGVATAEQLARRLSIHNFEVT